VQDRIEWSKIPHSPALNPHGFPWRVRFGLVPFEPADDHNQEPYLLTR
jgi:hypothetical protein